MCFVNYPTSYAILNIMTDFISHQDEYNVIPLFYLRVGTLYRRPTSWISEFSANIQIAEFNFKKYLEEYLKYLN